MTMMKNVIESAGDVEMILMVMGGGESLMLLELNDARSYSHKC